jgi:hypothetical protein
VTMAVMCALPMNLNVDPPSMVTKYGMRGFAG